MMNDLLILNIDLWVFFKIKTKKKKKKKKKTIRAFSIVYNIKRDIEILILILIYLDINKILNIQIINKNISYKSSKCYIKNINYILFKLY